MGNRYELLEQIGAGGMGAVYSARDRLTGKQVALKQVTRKHQSELTSTFGTTLDFRLALAQEFRTLASLRHPYIISVLDYGFDVEQPYFTMDLLDEPVSIVTYGQDQPYEVKTQLMVQVLQALAYLHRRGIVHRDLKPDNVLVVQVDGQPQVKVLDFGLAVARGHADTDQATVGTIAYIAPEVLQGYPASEASDIYAMGVIAYELFAGRHPFDVSNIGLLIQDVITTEPDISRVDAGKIIRSTIRISLAKSPVDRRLRVQDMIDQYVESTGQTVRYEPANIRESYLQAAEFIGRDAELARLTDALSHTQSGHGGLWLVGGESGVGKSRLLDELRTHALVTGALVLRGQAVTESGTPYALWRPVLRRLSLETTLTGFEASVLKPIIPGRVGDAADAPLVEPNVAQARILDVVEELLRRVASRTVLILLEDLQWAGPNELALLKRVDRIAPDLPLLVVVSFRDDERPELADEFPRARLITLDRLDRQAIEQLTASMLGEETGRLPQVIELLERETEGNAFFMVEVVRTLAEDAGHLEQIGTMTLPQQVFAGGIQAVVTRRIEQVPAAALPLLRVAAVAGRHLDMHVLSSIEMQMDFDDWLLACEMANVLEIDESNRWRFVHDKLREGLLADLDVKDSRRIHRQVADAIQRTYPGESEYAAVLAEHYHAAGAAEEEAHHAGVAAERALLEGDSVGARDLLERAIALHERIGTDRRIRGQLEQLLGDANNSLGLVRHGLDHSVRALDLLGWPQPASRRLDLLRQIGLQMAWRLSGWQQSPDPDDTPARLAAVHACNQIAISAFFMNDRMTAAHAIIKGLNLAEKGGESLAGEIALSSAGMSFMLAAAAQRWLSRYYSRYAARHLALIDDPVPQAYVRLLDGITLAGWGRWSQARACFEETMTQAEQAGDLRRIQQARAQLGTTHYFTGHWDQTEAHYTAYMEQGTRRESVQEIAEGRAALAAVALRRGDIDAALVGLNAVAPMFAEIELLNGTITTTGLLALAHWQAGDETLARDNAAEFLAIIQHGGSAAYNMLDGYYGALGYALRRCERERDNQQAVTQMLRSLRGLAQVFPVCRPLYLIYGGWFAWLDGARSRGTRMLSAGIAKAQTLTMPHDEGIGCYHLGRLTGERLHLSRAVGIFETLGAAWDLEQAQ